MHDSSFWRTSRPGFIFSLALGLFTAASGQGTQLDLGQTTVGQTTGGLRQQQPGLQRGFGGADFSTGGIRGLLGGAGTSSEFGVVPSDQTPYITDFPLVDSEYVVGPGDIFQLHFESSSIEKQVTPEGSVILNRIGVAQVDGLTLREAKARILDKLSIAYRRSECYVGLSSPKVMRVFVTGAVVTPGTYEIPANFRLSDALRNAGGFSPIARKDEIRITTPEGGRRVNLGAFLSDGDIASNPYLRSGAVVHVPYVDYGLPWVIVRRDGGSFTIQTTSGESLVDAVLKSYSFAPPAPYSALLVRERDGQDTIVPAAEAAGYKPGPGAYVEIIPARQEIFVAGAVAAPGLQPHVSDRKVIEYISTAGLLTSSKVPRKIQVVRVDGKRVSLPLQSADLRPGDVLFVRQNTEQKFLIYTPILLSFVSLSLAVITVFGL